jgi:hypothetical protein
MARGRAYRRHQSQRVKSRVRRVVSIWYRGQEECIPDSPRWFGYLASTHCCPPTQLVRDDHPDRQEFRIRAYEQELL